MIHQKANKKLITITWLVVAVLAFSLWTPPIMAAEVPLEADSAILIEARTGQVLYDKNSHQAQAPASVTKLMTLAVAFEAIENGKGELSDKVVTSENAWRLGGSQIYLEPGEEMTLEELLIAIAVGSANDACVAVAEHLFGTHEEFVEVMNEKARELGLKNTHFVNSYGLPAEGHYSSPYDMAQISRYALRFPKLLEMTSIKEYDLRGGEFHLYNTNKLLWWYKGADGFKTGWTNEARYCLASTAERDGLRLIAVVFGSPQRHGNFRQMIS
jgi:D-alanyl-D-alanine carboxypeptidase (penicillin-binding protein 5/6)